MSEQDKAKVVEEYLPTVESIIDEYRGQGKELSRQEAEKIREQLRADLAAGHVDAMENILGDNAMDNVVGGGLVPRPSMIVGRTDQEGPESYIYPKRCP